MTENGNESKKARPGPENVDVDGTETPVKREYGDVLIPEYRIEKALRHYLTQPLTRDYIGTVHKTVDFLARDYLHRIAQHSEHTFTMRNKWLGDANRKAKTRMDIGVLSDLYYEIGKLDKEKLDAIDKLVKELKASIGHFKTVAEVQKVLLGDMANKVVYEA